MGCIAVVRIQAPTGQPADFTSNKEAKGAAALRMVLALTSAGGSVQGGQLIFFLESVPRLEWQSQSVPGS